MLRFVHLGRSRRVKLHWSPKSPFVRKVMIAAHECGLADRIELVRNVAAMARPNAAIMVDNPLGKAPTLKLDSGVVLYDSTVICEYLDDLATRTASDRPLFPNDDAGRWDALRRNALGSGLLWFARFSQRPAAVATRIVNDTP